MANKQISDYTELTSPTSGDLHLIQSGSTYKKLDHDNLLEGLTTDDLDEGVSSSRLYFSDERAQDAAGAMATNGDDITLTYSDAGNTLTPGLAASRELIFTYQKVFDQVDILTAYASPINFGMTTASNKCIIPISAFVYYDNQAGAAYGNGDFEIQDRTTGDAIFKMSSAFLNTSENLKYGMCVPSTTEAELTTNTDLRLKFATANPTGGGSGNRIIIQIKYQFTPDVTGM